VSPVPAWRASLDVDVIATALARMWKQIASADTAPWKQTAAKAAHAWAAHRQTV